tara:strand:+ start:500 stop:1093 length:594 start_codon:yes stop_codon:yes gene_type:complete
MANISNQGAASQVAFGQYGSAFHDTDSNVITPPEGLVIVAIAFLADSSFDKLVAEDAGKVFNFDSAANAAGQFERKVNQGTTSTNKIIFDDTNAASGVRVGDKIFQKSTGVSHGVVTALDPDGNNANEIQVSVAQTVQNDDDFVFITPDVNGGEGAGGQAIDESQVFPKGMTIYGRWTSASINSTASAAGIICYFGP